MIYHTIGHGLKVIDAKSDETLCRLHDAVHGSLTPRRAHNLKRSPNSSRAVATLAKRVSERRGISHTTSFVSGGARRHNKKQKVSPKEEAPLPCRGFFRQSMWQTPQRSPEGWARVSSSSR